jgi:hypothetical protein
VDENQLTATRVDLALAEIVCALYQIVSECNGAETGCDKNTFLTESALL